MSHNLARHGVIILRIQMSLLPAAVPRAVAFRLFAVVLLLVAVVPAGIYGFRRAPAQLLISSNAINLPADGESSTQLTLRTSDGRRVDKSDIAILSPDANQKIRAKITQAGRELHLRLTARVQPGTVPVQIVGRNLHGVSLHVTLTPSDSDRFRDGTPDFLRLNDPSDRDAFRRWFTLLADYESLAPPEKRNSEINDCAALIRFAYRGALHAHDASWMVKSKLDSLPSVPSVQKYEYPFTPLDAAFLRVKPGPFTRDDLSNGTFAQFADAKTLKQLNSYFVSRDVRQARPGDILFYRQLEQNEPYHSMIFLGQSQIERDPAELVVYHTGPDKKSRGEIRRVRLTDLMQHPSPRWRPVPANSNFLGVYRWNILREAD